MDIASLLNQARADGTLTRLMRNVLAQFGRPQRRYLGAELLPERMVEENQYTEESIRYRTIVANGGTRYGPAQKKGGDLIGTFDVKLANSDIARELSGRDYDILLRYLGRNASMDAIAALTNWAETTLNLALIEVNEAWRWQAIVDASVIIEGDNAFREPVALTNPAGHRVNVADDWADPTYDPFQDIYAMADLLQSKGYTVGRMFAGTPVLTKLARNPKVAARTSHFVANNGGALELVAGRASLMGVNMALQMDGLPPIERYDLRYNTQNGDVRFLHEQAFVLVALTGRNEELDIPDGEQTLITDTSGYTAIGKPAGHSEPGRVINTEFKTDKPPRIEGQAWQTSFPILAEPEAVAVLKNI